MLFGVILSELSMISGTTQLTCLNKYINQLIVLHPKLVTDLLSPTVRACPPGKKHLHATHIFMLLRHHLEEDLNNDT